MMKLKVNWPIFSVNNDYSNNHNANNNSKRNVKQNSKGNRNDDGMRQSIITNIISGLRAQHTLGNISQRITITQMKIKLL